MKIRLKADHSDTRSVAPGPMIGGACFGWESGGPYPGTTIRYSPEKWEPVPPERKWRDVTAGCVICKVGTAGDFIFSHGGERVCHSNGYRVERKELLFEKGPLKPNDVHFVRECFIVEQLVEGF